MSFKTELESRIKERITVLIEERSTGSVRPWVESDVLDKNIRSNETVSHDVTSLRIVYPIHSHEVMEMEEEDFSNLIYSLYQSLESSMKAILSEFGNKPIDFAENGISINLGYRIIELYYSYTIITIAKV